MKSEQLIKLWIGPSDDYSDSQMQYFFMCGQNWDMYFLDIPKNLRNNEFESISAKSMKFESKGEFEEFLSKANNKNIFDISYDEGDYRLLYLS